MNNFLPDDIVRYIGRTVTVFTESGGLSGSGFTGTLAGFDGNSIRIITQIGAAPACPIGSACASDANNAYSLNNSNPFFNGSSWLGSVSIIPINKIVSFVHSSI